MDISRHFVWNIFDDLKVWNLAVVWNVTLKSEVFQVVEINTTCVY
jgi:hypothetical protein